MSTGNLICNNIHIIVIWSAIGNNEISNDQPIRKDNRNNLPAKLFNLKRINNVTQSGIRIFCYAKNIKPKRTSINKLILGTSTKESEAALECRQCIYFNNLWGYNEI